MQLHGFPISAKLPEDLGIGERFWYWCGASGRNYIHSIYAPESCPPLPGAIFIAVRRRTGSREALAIGRFPGVMETMRGTVLPASLSRLAADEIHVHLLARDELTAAAVLDDLKRAECEAEIAAMPFPGFQEAAQLPLAFA